MSNIHKVTQELENAVRRSSRYFDRMTTSASDLADMRKLLGVPHQAHRITMERLSDVLDLAARWVKHQDASVGGRDMIGWDG